MSVSVSMFIAISLALLAIASLVLGEEVRRRVQRPRALVAALVATSAVFVPLNLYVHVAVHDHRTPAARMTHWVDLLATVSVVVVLAAFAYKHRIPRVPAHHPRRILAIGAHPDDLELACGGTLAKFCDSGHEVHALVMSAGERGGNSDVRRDEAVTGGRFLGVTTVDVVGLPDLALAREADRMVEAIETAIRRYNPDIVLTHSRNDQHQDHQAVHLATLRGARRHSSILCFESPSATADFKPSVFVEIDDYVEVKVAAVGAHRDQSGKPYMAPERVRGIAAFRGGQAKAQSAEAYEPVRLLTSSGGDL